MGGGGEGGKHPPPALDKTGCQFPYHINCFELYTHVATTSYPGSAEALGMRLMLPCLCCS